MTGLLDVRLRPRPGEMLGHYDNDDDRSAVLNCLTDAGTVLELGTTSHMENGVEYSCMDDEPTIEGSGEEMSVNSCPEFADGSDDITIGNFLICCISKRFKGCVDEYGDSIKSGHFVLGKGLLKYCNIQRNGLRARIEPKGCFNGSRSDDVEDVSFHVKKYTVWRQGDYDMRCGDEGIHVYRCYHIFNVVALVPGLAFTFKCYVHNNDRSLLAIVLITAHWGFCLLAFLNELFLNIEENYISLRLLLLGALGAKAYQNVQLNGSVQKTDFSSFWSSALRSKLDRGCLHYRPDVFVSDPAQSTPAADPPQNPHFSGVNLPFVILVQEPALAASAPVDHSTEDTPVRSQLAQEPPPTAPPSTPAAASAYQPMDPRLRETLQKIRTELETALRATASPTTRVTFRSRNDEFARLEGTQPSSYQSRLHTLRDQLGTGWFSDGTQPSSFQSRLHTLRDQLGTAVPTSTTHLGTAVPTSTTHLGTVVPTSTAQLGTAVPTSTAHRTVPTARGGTALNTGVEQAEVVCDTAERVPTTASEYRTAACASEASVAQGDHVRAPNTSTGGLQDSPAQE
ncbi:hypothetical protein TELCIR_05661, partial [Teladorsagia circumcincta]